jgi:hypothetical protein
VTVAFRPEEASFDGAAGADNVLKCRVERAEFRGAFVRHYLTLLGGGADVVLVDAPAAALPDLAPGATADLYVRPESVRVFHDAGAAR